MFGGAWADARPSVFQIKHVHPLKPDPRALIVDSEKASRRLLRTVLESQGYQILQAEGLAAGLERAVEGKPDVIVMEMALADGEGLEFLRNLREWSHTPVLVLSERNGEEAKVAALDAGANDYITKPFNGAELLARLRVLQRPLFQVPDGPLLVEGDLVANFSTHEISVAGRPVGLTRKEEALFYVLARHAGKVVTRAQLLHSVWGMDSEERIHDLHVLMGNLRKKLEPHGKEIFITTQGGLGYTLSLRNSQASRRAAAEARHSDAE